MPDQDVPPGTLPSDIYARLEDLQFDYSVESDEVAITHADIDSPVGGHCHSRGFRLIFSLVWVAHNIILSSHQLRTNIGDFGLDYRNYDCPGRDILMVSRASNVLVLLESLETARGQIADVDRALLVG